MDGYMGSIQMCAFNFTPQNYAACGGATLSIAQNTALFSLIGTYFGGNGQSTFQLPNLQGVVPMGMGGQFVIGEKIGTSSATLTAQQMPTHTHIISEHTPNATATLHAKTGVAEVGAPANHYLAIGTTVDKSTGVEIYTAATPNTTLASDAVTIDAANLVNSPAGGSQPMSLYQPSLAINYVICTNGLYPARN